MFDYKARLLAEDDLHHYSSTLRNVSRRGGNYGDSHFGHDQEPHSCGTVRVPMAEQTSWLNFQRLLVSRDGK